MHYTEILREEFNLRKGRNASFSLRSYSRYLGLGPTLIADILADRKKLPREKVFTVAEKLALSDDRLSDFICSVNRDHVDLAKVGAMKLKNDFILINEESLKDMFSDIDYHVLLCLTRIKDFKSDYTWIAKKMNINPEKVEIMIQKLQGHGFVDILEGDIVCLIPNYETTNGIAQPDIRRIHHAFLKLAQEKIETVDLKDRLYNLQFMHLNKARLPEAKKLLIEFRQKLAQLMEGVDSDEVYTVALQLIPMTSLGEVKEELKKNA
jgi:uncharacterized protein (TIGR02147 family)